MRRERPGPTIPTGLGPAWATCPRCRQAAVESVAQALLYLIASAAPSLISPGHDGSLEYAFGAGIRVADLAGRLLTEDELTIEQRAIVVSAAADIEGPEEADPGEAAGERPPTHQGPGHVPAQPRILVDSVALRPAGADGFEGRIAGRLLDQERLTARFEVAVGPPAAASRVG